MEILDISHLVRPFGVREGSVVLAESVGYFPNTVHLAVVDPGVGSLRRPLVLVTVEGSPLVGPDNGLLLPAADRLGGVESAWQITNRELGRPDPSSTFHGRDIFAPAAAHLAGGVSPSRFGPQVEAGSLVQLPLGKVEQAGDSFRGEVLLVDRFGNLQTSFRRTELGQLGLGPGDSVELRLGGRRLTAVLRESYSFGAPGELQVIEDSHGNLAVCVNRGSAAELLGVPAAGSTVVLARAEPDPEG